MSPMSYQTAPPRDVQFSRFPESNWGPGGSLSYEFLQKELIIGRLFSCANPAVPMCCGSCCKAAQKHGICCPFPSDFMLYYPLCKFTANEDLNLMLPKSESKNKMEDVMFSIVSLSHGNGYSI